MPASTRAPIRRVRRSPSRTLSDIRVMLTAPATSSMRLHRVEVRAESGRRGGRSEVQHARDQHQDADRAHDLHAALLRQDARVLRASGAQEPGAAGRRERGNEHQQAPHDRVLHGRRCRPGRRRARPRRCSSRRSASSAGPVPPAIGWTRRGDLRGRHGEPWRLSIAAASTRMHVSRSARDTPAAASGVDLAGGSDQRRRQLARPGRQGDDGAALVGRVGRPADQPVALHPLEGVRHRRLVDLHLAGRARSG